MEQNKLWAAMPMGDMTSGMAALPLFGANSVQQSDNHSFFEKLPEHRQQEILRGCTSAQEFHNRIEQAKRKQ